MTKTCPTNRSGRGFWGRFCFGLLLLLAWAAPAPAQFSSAKVARIEIKHVGPRAVSDDLVRANIRVKPGDSYLRAAIDDPDPVLFFEHKHLYRRLKDQWDEAPTARLGEAALRKDGTRACILTYGAAQHVALEAVADQLNKLPQDKIKVRIIRQGVGAVTEGDVLLAAASNAIVIGFNVRPERKAAEIAERDEVELRLYTIIYDVAEEMKKAMEGLLEPTIREVRLGAAEVRDTFKISKVGTIAGCFVQDGKVTRTAQVRLLRDNVVIHTGRVSSLKRFKDDASEVRTGFECGAGIANFNDVKVGDQLEAFSVVKLTGAEAAAQAGSRK